ncbi:MAG: aspartate 1-decarboxylase [Opitutales bacterium]|nr:aspartate 1-decarboxylase [Opitutales bacterium]
MNRTFLKSKLHKAVVTDANLHYRGSISICPKLMEAADLLEFEQVDVYNINNGERLTTYVIVGNDAEICLNGAAARKAEPGDRVIIASFASLSEEELQEFKPTIVMVTEQNRCE